MAPFHWLLILFITVPLVEIYLLIELGGLVGTVPTIMLVVLTAMVGAKLVRAQGLITIARVRHSLDQGEVPAMTLLEGVVLLVAGALLLTPGFLTDLLGFLALVPDLRRRAIRWLLQRAVMASDSQQTPRRGPQTLDGEYHRDE